MTTPAPADQFAYALLGYADTGGISGLPVASKYGGSGPTTYVTPGNVSFVEHWIAREGTSAKNNPLATTLKTSDSVPLPGNTAGVQQYPGYMEGVDATAATFGNGYYPDILAAIASGHADQIDAAGGLAGGLSKWSGGSYTSVSNTTINPNPPSLNENQILSAGGVAKADQWGLGSLTSWTDGLKKVLGFLTTGSNWKRIGEFALGLALVVFGSILLFKNEAANAVTKTLLA